MFTLQKHSTEDCVIKSDEHNDTIDTELYQNGTKRKGLKIEAFSLMSLIQLIRDLFLYRLGH